MSDTLISAHRCGPHGIYEPNSIEAIKSSIHGNIDFIEFDVRTTNDKKFILSHDSFININGKHRRISDISSQNISKNNKKILFLDDALKIIKNKARAHVDIKDKDSELEIVDKCTHYLGVDNFIVTSLEAASISKIKSARPAVKAGLSIGRNLTGYTWPLKLKVRFGELLPWWRIRKSRSDFIALNYKFTKFGHLLISSLIGLPCLLWTLDTKQLLKQYINRREVWMVTTDYPEVAIELKNK